MSEFVEGTAGVKFAAPTDAAIPALGKNWDD